MKANVCGIDVEGTPEEVARLIRLASAMERAALQPTPIQYAPYQPWSRPGVWWIGDGQMPLLQPAAAVDTARHIGTDGQPAFL